MPQHSPGRLPRSQGLDLRWALIHAPLHPFSGEIIVPTAHQPWQWQASSRVARSIAVTKAPPCFRPFGGSLGLRIQKEAGWPPALGPALLSARLLVPDAAPWPAPRPAFSLLLPAHPPRPLSPLLLPPGPLEGPFTPGLGSECPLAMAAVHIPSWHLEIRDKNVTRS